MAELATIARPYANAVFGIAKDAGDLDGWSRQLGTLAAVADTSAVRRLVGQPQRTAEEKAAILVELCGDALDEGGSNLVRVLAENRRLGLLPEIVEQFEVLKAREQQTLDVQVTTAYDLADSEVEALADALRSKLGVAVELTSRTDDSLIGGAVIRAGDTVIDGSLRGRLGRLQETLQRRA